MTYKRHTLAELISALRGLPADADVEGFSEEIESYRGYYERNAIAPNWHHVVNAHKLAAIYEEQLYKPTEGYKGGDYTVAADQLVYLAVWGDTGPSIIGLARDWVSDIYEPVLLEEDFHW